MSNNVNQTLGEAKKKKNDDFYTQLTDIEKELKHYKHHFSNKTVYCNCDDPKISKFFHYFSHKFEDLKLKKLISTCYKNKHVDLFSVEDDKNAIALEYFGDKNNNKVPDDNEIGIKNLKGDGDFRSEECIKFLEEVDIVVTNPPFSLFREYISQLIKYDKKFIILGQQGSITYKEVFSLIQKGDIWLGVDNGGTKWFEVKDHYEIKTKSRQKIVDGKKFFSMGSVVWFTNLEIKKRKEELVLHKKYSEEEYPKYDNYDAIHVKRYDEIPLDFDGVMGVPITFLDKHNKNQFEILGITDRQNTSGLRTKKYTIDDAKNYNDLNARSVLKTDDGYKAVFARILIRRIK